MLKLSKFCAYTGQKLAQLGEKIAQARWPCWPLFESLAQGTNKGSINKKALRHLNWHITRGNLLHNLIYPLFTIPILNTPWWHASGWVRICTGHNIDSKSLDALIDTKGHLPRILVFSYFDFASAMIWLTFCATQLNWVLGHELVRQKGSEEE